MNAGPVVVNVEFPTWLAITLLVLNLFWMWWDIAHGFSVGERADGAADVADQAIGRIEAVENHLTGLEAPGRGRHARPTPQPRAVA